MDKLFGKKPTVQEQMRANDRQLRKVTRDVERDRRELEREEKKLEMEIKKAAKMGNKQACTVLAKQLVQLRKQKNRTYAATSTIQATGYAAKGMAANVKLAEAMGKTSKTMGQMNKAMDPMKVASTMKEFEMANAKMSMTEETMNDALDDILAESGDEEEEQGIVNQVLDEIGIEISGKMSDAPSAHQGKLGADKAASQKKDKEIEDMLAALKSWNVWMDPSKRPVCILCDDHLTVKFSKNKKLFNFYYYVINTSQFPNI